MGARIPSGRTWPMSQFPVRLEISAGLHSLGSHSVACVGRSRRGRPGRHADVRGHVQAGPFASLRQDSWSSP
eukprot:5229215-Heterocapsa_arctica.AAC.1